MQNKELFTTDVLFPLFINHALFLEINVVADMNQELMEF